VQRGTESPICFDDVVDSTLATVRVDESIATGKAIAIDSALFLETALTASA